MKISASGFGRGLIIALIVSLAVGGTVYKVLGLGRRAPDQDSPEVLIARAKAALEAVRERDLRTTLRPARYDGIMIPLDTMLRLAREKAQSPEYEPVADYEYIRSYTEPVLAVAQEAFLQAQSETSFLKSEFRFMEQKGDACQYWATALWNRLEALHDRKQPRERELQGFVPSPADSRKMYSIIETGLHASPTNKFLWYVRSLVERSNGAFIAAEKSLKRALEIDPEFVAAWNDLGLVLVNLKRFSDAEKALVAAMNTAMSTAERAGEKPGVDYYAAVMNLASFHYSLAVFFQHETRIAATPENESELTRHRKSATKYLREIIDSAPAGIIDVPAAKDMLRKLG